ncbi:MAG: hypothetical protein Fur0032_16090 [Terrimicrobiaceae bacterium]
MASVALVDSNVFISLLRSGLDPAAWLGGRFEDIYTCGMVRVEVLRGQKNRYQRDVLAAFFNILCNIPMDNRLWEEAAELAWQQDRSGRSLPSPDIVIAACAIQAGVPVLTDDSHFDFIHGVRVIRFREL